MSEQPKKGPDYGLAAAQYFIDTFGRNDGYQAEHAVRGFVESLGGDFDKLNHEAVTPYAASAYLAALVFRAAVLRDNDDKK